MKLFGTGSARPPRRWTVLVLSEHENSARQYGLSERWVRVGLTGAVVVTLSLSVFLAGFVIDADTRLRSRRLARENDLLAQQVSRHREALEELHVTMQDLQKRDEAFRLMAGLEPIEPAVYGAGIGGPG